MSRGNCDGVAAMFRFDIFGSDVGRFILRYIGDDLATFTAHGPQKRSHETEEGAQEIADPMPSEKVQWRRIDEADPRSRGNTTTRLI